MSSCDKDENVPQTDYSIESTERFEITGQYQNGWIKQGQYHRSGELTEEFEYFENGYIKSAKVYSSYPQQHLYMEVNRSEENKPLWSKYYHPNGELWFETDYANGLPLVKKVYSELGTAIHSYINGELSSVVFTVTDNSSISTTTYNIAEGTRNVSITSSGQIILDESYPYQEQVGAGVCTYNDVPVANAFGATESSYTKLNQSFSASPSWQNDADPREFMFPYRLFNEFYNPGDNFATRFAVSTDLYQSVIEQYPITENGVLIGGGSYQDGYDYLPYNWEVRDSLSKMHNENPALYELKYGNEYVEKVGYGSVFFVIGAIRNLPTNSQTANDIKNIAQKRMNELLNGHTSLSPEEQEMLNKVWFEIKFFSSLKAHRSGLVLNSNEDYENAMEELNNAELSVIQLKYQSVENL